MAEVARKIATRDIETLTVSEVINAKKERIVLQDKMHAAAKFSNRAGFLAWEETKQPPLDASGMYPSPAEIIAVDRIKSFLETKYVAKDKIMQSADAYWTCEDVLEHWEKGGKEGDVPFDAENQRQKSTAHLEMAVERLAELLRDQKSSGELKKALKYENDAKSFKNKDDETIFREQLKADVAKRNEWREKYLCGDEVAFANAIRGEPD